MANFDPSIKVGFVRIHQIIALCLAVVFIVVAALATLEIERFYRDKFLPNTFVNAIDVSNLTFHEAQQALAGHTADTNFALTLHAENTIATLSGELLRPKYDYEQALITAQTTNGAQSWPTRYLRALGIGQAEHFTALLECDTTSIASAVATLAAKTHRPNTYPSVKLQTSGNPRSIIIHPGEVGYELDATASAERIQTTCSNLTSDQLTQQSTIDPIELIAQPAPDPLSQEEITALRTAAEKLVNKKVTLKIQNQVFHLSDQQLVALLATTARLDEQKLHETLQAISKQVLAEPINAELSYDPTTLKVTSFTPPRDGLTIDQANTQNQLIAAIQRWLNSETTEPQQEVAATITAKKPEITLDKTNNLGINELIGLGESAYAHSIPTRVHNVALTAKKINLNIIKPGETFSFNKALGEVSKATGFQPAYVIKNGRTELGDGGGVCQVSSTLFRAAMNAGLNITLRKPHSYRVSYYELNSKAGFDATVYAGEVDFRFINDTPGHILLYTETDSKNLTMKIELYGTSDGRTSEISDYKAWGARPAPPPVYIDDPSLPPGKVKQVDWATGGLKTSFVYTVKDKFGTVKQQETYYSNYLPWSAKYLRGPAQ